MSRTVLAFFERDFSKLASILVHVITLFVAESRNPQFKLANSRVLPTSEFTISWTKTDLTRHNAGKYS